MKKFASSDVKKKNYRIFDRFPLRVIIQRRHLNEYTRVRD